MKKLLLTAFVVIGAALVSTSAAATTIYLADLDGLHEVPPNNSPGQGDLTATLHDDLDTLDVSVVFRGLVAPDTAAHLHCCAPNGVNAPVRLPLTGFPLGDTFGTYFHTFSLSADLTDITPAAFIASLDGGEVYANIHTVLFPGGEIRGQLAAQAVPEPGWLTLFGMGLLGVMRAVRRRL